MKPKLAKNRSPRPSKKQGTKSSRRRSAGATARAIIARLKAHANPDNVAGMARFGINPRNTLGVSIPLLRRIAREHGRDHAVAALLWQSGIHEARILASMIDEPARLTGPQMDRWARGFDSWDVCDQCCANLFEDSPLAWKKALAWSKS